MIHFEDIAVLSFDCYGTLIDWETGLLAALRPGVERYADTISDDQLLEAFAVAEPAAEEQDPAALYPDVLRTTHGLIADALKIPRDPMEADHVANSVGDWPAFEDSADALRRLQSRFQLVILSNIDNASFARSNTRLGVTFDAIVTAEDVGAYKPDHRMFHRLFEVIADMGLACGQLVHIAQSLYHDHVPAKQLGLQTVWVDRRCDKSGCGATPSLHSNVTPDLTVATLAELADYVEGQ